MLYILHVVKKFGKMYGFSCCSFRLRKNNYVQIFGIISEW